MRIGWFHNAPNIIEKQTKSDRLEEDGRRRSLLLRLKEWTAKLRGRLLKPLDGAAMTRGRRKCG